MKPTIWLGAAAAASLLAACTPEPQPSARNDFLQYCASCHGDSGKGNGPAAAAMNPQPSDLTRIAARHQGHFPKLQMFERVNGYTMGATDSHMPAFGDLLDGPTISYDPGDGNPTPMPARMVALVEYLQTIQQ
ncbi:MAG: cytochrome c [Paracoccus sp. (in: a-proteobacteria)]|uniref:c-type cytochrome n=1 Tax=Paracoccus sp. TaxID=267 RepID=UPI0026E0F3E3|nr:cytochrome c [Paracoccus sp. (in: a-proteobacteria)]MDO5621130.1 cytochrome c [Paracoccus sp. (in: a-proteobacteria)]